MDTRIKEVLEAKNCPLIYAADADNGLEISYRGGVKEILSLVGTFMLSVSTETGIPLDSLFVELISSSTAALRELEEEYGELKERKVGKN